MTQSPSVSFDYSAIDSDTAQFIQQQTGEIRVLMRRTTQDIFEIGQKLIVVKERLGYRRFGEWLAAEFAWTDRTAQRFMNVVEAFAQHSDTMSALDFAPTALYTLAAPSLPQEAREEAITRAKEGEAISAKKAQEIKKKYPSAAKDNRKSATRPSTQPTLPLKASQSKPLTHSEVFPPTTTPESTKPPQIPTLSKSQKPLEIVSVRSKWSQLGNHWLFEGHPQSEDFQRRLPQEIDLWLTFAPTRDDWLPKVNKSIKAALSFFKDYQRDLEADDLGFFRALLKTHLNLYSEQEGETVVLAFLPTPDLLLIASEWDCQCFVAEPNLARLEAASATWQKRQKTEL